MRKLKNALVLLLTVLLIAAGSLLPTVAAYVQDKTTANAVQYESIEALQLKLEEEVLSMAYQEKMFLMMHGMGMEITDENTKIKEEQIIEVTYSALAPYMEMFLGRSFDNDYIEYYPVMVYDESDPSRYAYYWHVTMSLDMSLDDSLSVILDDEAGKILAIEMIDPEMNIDPAYLQELQYALAAAYLGDLGIEPVAEWPVAVETADKNEAMGIPLAATGYVFIDDIHGVEVNVQIGVRPDGFYIYLV